VIEPARWSDGGGRECAWQPDPPWSARFGVVGRCLGDGACPYRFRGGDAYCRDHADSFYVRSGEDRALTDSAVAELLAAAPDRALRDGRRALDIATAVHATAATPVHFETVALALAELGRCSEAADWMRKAIDEARRTNEVVDAVRLEDELPKYLAAECRP